jgi:hypothetical protein
MLYTQKGIYLGIYNTSFFSSSCAQLGSKSKNKHKNKTKKMADIFENAILCRKCKKEMKPVLISKNRFNLRALKCSKCNEIIVHPVDKQEYENFVRLKQKEFEVKMRMVGNSYAISIPREIVDFMKDQEKMINDMVRLSFDNANSLSLNFNVPKFDENNPNMRSRVIQAKEYSVVKNNKPVLHVKQVYDSANPKNNKTQVFKNTEKEEDFEEEEH